MHGIELLSVKPLAVSKGCARLLTTLCQEHAFHVGCAAFFGGGRATRESVHRSERPAAAGIAAR